MVAAMLDPRRLAALQAVARHGSVTAAARALDYTQPAISHQLARLEHDVGIPLLVRAGRSVRLTEAGAALAGHADAILARLADAEEDLAAFAGLRAGRVRLVAFPSGSASLVPVALAALARAHPGVRASFVEEEPPEALALLAAGEADVALVFAYPEDEGVLPAHLEAEALLDDELLACLPAGHPAAAGPGPVDLAELAGDPWIAGCERCRSHLLHAAAQAGFRPRIVHETDDAACVQGLVAAGLGVALLPALGLDALRRADVAVRALRRPAPRTVLAVAVVPPRPPAVQALLTVLRQAAGPGTNVPA